MEEGLLQTSPLAGLIQLVSPSLCCRERRPRGDPEYLLGSSQLPGCPLPTAPCRGSSRGTKHRPLIARQAGWHLPSSLPGRPALGPSRAPFAPLPGSSGSSAGSPGPKQASGPGLGLGLVVQGGWRTAAPVCGLLRGLRGAGGHGGSLGSPEAPAEALQRAPHFTSSLGGAGHMARCREEPAGLSEAFLTTQGGCSCASWWFKWTSGTGGGLPTREPVPHPKGLRARRTLTGT